MSGRIFVSVFMLTLAGCTIAPGFDSPRDLEGITILPVTDELVLAQAAEQPEAVELPESTPGGEGSYRLGPHDVLSVHVFGHPELNQPTDQGEDAAQRGYLVGPDGTIHLPYTGRQRVAGKTLDQVRRQLVYSLQPVVPDAQIDLKVIAYRSRKVYVVGEVARPGVQPLTDAPLTVLDALGAAGGPTAEADLSAATLTREERVYPLDLSLVHRDGRRNIAMRNGDILQLPAKEQRQVYVIGEVLNPRPVAMEQHRLSLTKALMAAGSINPVTARPTDIFVIRGNPGNTEIFHLDARTPAALVLGDYFQLQPRDVVYVDTAGVTRWSRVISQILPSVQFLGQPNLLE